MLYSCIETPPSEPPIFEIPPSVTVLDNEPIFIQIVASVPGTNSTEGLYLYVENLPARSTFSRGRREGERWIITPEDFGEIELDLPGFSGMLNLEITAVTPGASRQRSLLVNVYSNTTGENTTDETATTTDQAPATTEETPEVTNTEGTPEVTERTPEVTEVTPEITEVTPEATEGTPEGTPEATEVTPETTGETPDTGTWRRDWGNKGSALHDEMANSYACNFDFLIQFCFLLIYRVSFWTRSHLAYNLGYYSTFYNWHPGMSWRGGVHR